MPRYKKNPYEKKRFESSGVSSDTSANIYMSMLMSAAWRELTPRQQILYLYCKAQYYAEKKKPIKDNQLSFTMNKSKWQLYKLYTENEGHNFRRDMNALISIGFVKCVECGANTRTKSIYEYSSKWLYYGTPEFEIMPSEMTKSLLNKREKQQSIVSTYNDVFGKNKPQKITLNKKEPENAGDETAELKAKTRKLLEEL